MTSAFIPFCSIGNNMAKIGRIQNGFTSPICNGFKPTILEGQLCYQIKIGRNLTFGNGPRNGLMILLDYNADRELTDETEADHIVSAPEIMVGQGNNDAYTTAKIHIDTLQPYTAFKEGRFAMWSIKEMSGTQSFLDLDLADRQCSTDESLQDCQSLGVQQGPGVCGCVPYGLSSVLVGNKVNRKCIFSCWNIFSLQTFCGPEGMECYAKLISKQNHCIQPCFGMYADFKHETSQEDEALLDSAFAKMVEEYEEFRRGYEPEMKYVGGLASK